ncbi:alpha/beta fold hydrolase [Streptomyces sp. DSM 42041]|uniref:Alpha/beta fold hydrolase n=1 Tax=Streptomyces hazeniae TaxID=3075538 RepID=A0ABU2NLQ6_9ACTN|nr:alpha/beta fold hydrolase [Streptomyces sp. DSM 42041]MDT0377911.1 alpha/beta fold hydrolase [Streptomyces sp. DSM 42041]
MELRLFVFHHAGGSHLPYRGWPALLPSSWDVRLVDAPGRGLGADLEPIPDAERLVDHFLKHLDPELDGDYAFFGHSMGGLIAYELTRRILDAGRVPPRWLGLSARSTPRPEGEGTQRHLLSDGELRRELVAMGGTPGAVLENRDIWELFAPVIRNDLRLVETWRPRPESTPMPVPLSVFGGRDDAVAPPERLAGWADRADRFLGLRLFEGGHFYFQPDPAAVLRQLVEDVHRALSPAEGPRRTAPVTG